MHAAGTLITDGHILDFPPVHITAGKVGLLTYSCKPLPVSQVGVSFLSVKKKNVQIFNKNRRYNEHPAVPHAEQNLHIKHN